MKQQRKGQQTALPHGDASYCNLSISMRSRYARHGQILGCHTSAWFSQAKRKHTEQLRKAPSLCKRAIQPQISHKSKNNKSQVKEVTNVWSHWPGGETLHSSDVFTYHERFKADGNALHLNATRLTLPPGQPFQPGKSFHNPCFVPSQVLAVGTSAALRCARELRRSSRAEKMVISCSWLTHESRRT